MTIEEIRGKKEELDEKYSKLFWNVEENKNAFSKSQYDLMQQHLHELYAREYNLLFGAELLELDKQIERQNIVRLHEMAEIERDKSAELEIIERDKKQRDTDKAIADGIAAAIDELRREEVIPKVYDRSWLRRFLRLPARKNRAQVLAERQLKAETVEYFARRENEVEGIEDRAYGVPDIANEIYETLITAITLPSSRRKREKLEDELWGRAVELAKLTKRRQTELQAPAPEPEPGTPAEPQDQAQAAEGTQQGQTDGQAEEAPQNGAEAVQTTIDTAPKPE